jgi:glycosyltransferase involved in cell wall biosynthesis
MNISVALTTYNGQKYIMEQLQSICNQSIKPDEIIIYDDCSNDNTIEIITNFILNNNINIKLYINQNNIGFTQNFAKAIASCNGDLIFIADQDDVWFNNKIEKILTISEQNIDKLVFIHDAYITNSNLSNNKVSLYDQVIRGYDSENSHITGAVTIIRKEFKDIFLPIPEKIVGHDIWIHTLALYLNQRKLIKEKLQLIRRHDTNSSNWIVSSPYKISKKDVYLSQYLSKPATDYTDRIYLNEQYINRLKKIENTIFNTNNISILINKLIKEKEALLIRNKLVNSSRTIRIILSIKLLLTNQYKYFNGLRSFLRDIVR